MIDISEVRIGDKVHYQPGHYAEDEWENGMVKSVHGSGQSVFVVYHCDNNWDEFQNYTGQLTPAEYLSFGWRH